MSIIRPSLVFEGSDLSGSDSWRNYMRTRDWKNRFKSATGQTFTYAFYLRLDLEAVHKETCRHLLAEGVNFSKTQFWWLAKGAWKRAAARKAGENKCGKQGKPNSEEVVADE